MARRRRARIETHSGMGRYTALGYRSTRIATKMGRSATGASGMRQVQYDRTKLLNQHREFYRDNPIYRGMLDQAVAYIVGTGFTLQMKTRKEAYNKRAERAWGRFWKKPEILGLHSGWKCERMICRELLGCGDTGIILMDEDHDNRIQLVEAEQITGRRGVGSTGITKNKKGQLWNAYVAGYGKGGFVSSQEAEPYRIGQDILFVADPERPSGIRAVPPCQASFANLHRINDVCDNEALAWQAVSRMAIKWLRKSGPQIGKAEAEAASDAGDDDLAQDITILDEALIVHGEPGDTIEGIERNLPTRNFGEVLVAFLRLLGMPLGLPLEVAFLNWTRTNYSGSRAVLEQAFNRFIGWQITLIEEVLTPILRWKLDRWAKAGELEARDVEDDEIIWIVPTFPWIDQLKEVQAWGARVDRGFTTYTSVCKSLRMDREENLKLLEKETVDAIELAQRIEKKTGLAVDWRQFAGKKEPKGTAGRPGGSEPANPADTALEEPE